MILYHYTALEYLDSIMEQGLSRGDVPTSVGCGKNGVWFTTDPDPTGHGLGEEFVLPTGGRIADKRAVRIAVKIPAMHRRLARWVKWGRKHCDPALFDGVNRAGGGKHGTWYVYFGVIEPGRFSDVEVLAPEKGRLVLAELPDGTQFPVYGSGLLKVIAFSGRSMSLSPEVRPVRSREEAEALAATLRPQVVDAFGRSYD